MILLSKKAGEYRGNRVIGKFQQGVFSISEVDERIPFERVQALRTPMPVRVITDNLATGHIFANLGISIALILKIQEHDYLVLTRPNENTHWKLICGYREAFEDIKQASLRELSEEVLPFDGKYYAFWSNGPLFSPYPLQVHTHYIPIEIGQFNDFFETMLPLNEHIGLYICPKYNSVQTIITATATLPTSVLELNHAEDQFVPSTGMLETRTISDGIRLVRLNGKVAQWDKTYRLTKGQLVLQDPITYLPEPFRVQETGICS